MGSLQKLTISGFILGLGFIEGKIWDPSPQATAGPLASLGISYNIDSRF